MDQNWYADIGVAIFKSKMIIAFMPYIEFILVYILRVLFRVYDRGEFYMFKKNKVE